MEDFGTCLYGKPIEALYSLLHCLHQLHEMLADDTAALALHLEKEHALVLRKCDICGENLTRHAVWEMLVVLKSVIERREANMNGSTDD